MRLVFLLVLLIGIGLAGFGVYMASEMFNRDQGELKQLRAALSSQVDLGPVVVASEELRYGQQLTPEMIKIVEWPVNARPENVFTSLEEILGPEGAKPRAITRLIEPGEAVLTTKVTNFGQDAGVSSRLSKGMRAFTIRVDVASEGVKWNQFNGRGDLFILGLLSMATFGLLWSFSQLFGGALSMLMFFLFVRTGFAALTYMSIIVIVKFLIHFFL